MDYCWQFKQLHEQAWKALPWCTQRYFFFEVIVSFPSFTPRWLENSLVLLLSFPNFSTLPQLLKVNEQASPTPMASVLSIVFNAETLLSTIA